MHKHILTDEVYTNLEKSNAKKAIGIKVKANKNAQKYLTPVTIGGRHTMQCQCHYWHIFKLLRNDVPSALVGKKVAHIVSSSESNNEIESLGSSLTDDKKIHEYLLNLPCLACNKNRKKRHTKERKEKGEKKRKKITNAVCEEYFTIKNGRSAQIPAFFEKWIVRPVEKKIYSLTQPILWLNFVFTGHTKLPWKVPSLWVSLTALNAIGGIHQQH
jgi:hypothetical protein